MLQNINKCLQQAPDLAEEAIEIDPFMEWKLKFKRALNDILCHTRNFRKALKEKQNSRLLMPASIKFQQHEQVSKNHQSANP